MKLLDATLVRPGWSGFVAALIPLLGLALLFGGLVIFVGFPWKPYVSLLPLMLSLTLAGVAGVHAINTPKAFALVFAAGIGATFLLACAIGTWDVDADQIVREALQR